MTGEKNKTCDKCCFYFEEPPTEITIKLVHEKGEPVKDEIPVQSGECRRHPPLTALEHIEGSDGGFTYPEFPLTLKDYWCGEFRLEWPAIIKAD